jgi:ATP-dependent Lon protease
MVPSPLPLFPLPLVLFPGTRLPLHIFEPRYRQMLADCMAGENMFGVLYRPEGVPERDIPAGHVGCVARVERAESLPDGRANVVVAGADRFALEGFEDTDRMYHVARVVNYDDADESAESLAPVASRVRDLFERVGRAARTLADDDDPLPGIPEDPRLLAFGIAAAIDMDVMARQRLLTLRSPGDRLREIELLLAHGLEPIEHRAIVHTRAKSNGHGPHSESVS